MTFPSPEELEVSKRASTHRHNERVETARRASELKTPDEVVEFALEIARVKLSRGKYEFGYEVVVKINNFKPWAIESGVTGEEMSDFGTMKTRNALTKDVQEKLNQQLGSGATCAIRPASLGPDRFSLKMVFTITKPS